MLCGRNPTSPNLPLNNQANPLSIHFSRPEPHQTRLTPLEDLFLSPTPLPQLQGLSSNSAPVHYYLQVEGLLPAGSCLSFSMQQSSSCLHV